MVFSDSSEPGEGEHKIMSFIRQQRSQPGYDPNQHHVLHGLDADLIMLALATHEPRFTILRELVTFGRRDKERKEAKIKARQAAQDALCTARSGGDVEFREDFSLKPLVMLRIWVLREYLMVEFSCLQRTLPFPFDFERIIDDFVFLCFFVGNDFLPHLPSLDIRDGALDFLQNTYKSILPSIGDYLTRDSGSVNLSAVSVIMAEVGDIEDEVFRRRHAAETQVEHRKEQVHIHLNRCIYCLYISSMTRSPHISYTHSLSLSSIHFVLQSNFIRNSGGFGRIGGAAGRDSAVAVGDNPNMEMHKVGLCPALSCCVLPRIYNTECCSLNCC